MPEQGARLGHPGVGAQAQPGASCDAVLSHRGAPDLMPREQAPCARAAGCDGVGSCRRSARGGRGGSGPGQLGLRSRSRHLPIGAELARAASTTSERPGGRRAPGCLGASNQRVTQQAEKQRGKAKFDREKSLSSAPGSARLQEPVVGGCTQLGATRSSGWRGGGCQQETLPGTDALPLQNTERRLNFSLRLNTSSPPGALGEKGHAKGKIRGRRGEKPFPRPALLAPACSSGQEPSIC